RRGPGLGALMAGGRGAGGASCGSGGSCAGWSGASALAERTLSAYRRGAGVGAWDRQAPRPRSVTYLVQVVGLVEDTQGVVALPPVVEDRMFSHEHAVHVLLWYGL